MIDEGIREHLQEVVADLKGIDRICNAIKQKISMLEIMIACRLDKKGGDSK